MDIYPPPAIRVTTLWVRQVDSFVTGQFLVSQSTIDAFTRLAKHTGKTRTESLNDLLGYSLFTNATS